VLDLELVVVEIEEAGRLATIGRVPHLRLAFVLLDNAVEVMLHREVEGETLFQGVNAAMKIRMQSMEHVHGDKPEFMALLADIEARVLPERKMDDLEERFRTKVNFLAERGRLDPGIATIVKTLHRYRNDLYHRLQLRREVLKPATLVYFDVACSILASWRFQRSWSSGEPYTDLARFGIAMRGAFKDDVTQDVATQFRATVDLDEAAVRAALTDHLTSRLDNLDQVIAMIRDAAPEEYDKPDDVFRIIQSDWKNDLPSPADLRAQRFPVSERKVQLWRRHVASLGGVSDRYAMYARYAEIEHAFESFEEEANDLYEAIDRMVQQAIDEERGK
jgi:hypothetical protein